MKPKRFTEEQIIGILKAAEAIVNIREACKEHNIAEQTFYRWRRKYGGMDVSEAKKLREEWMFIMMTLSAAGGKIKRSFLHRL